MAARRAAHPCRSERRTRTLPVLLPLGRTNKRQLASNVNAPRPQNGDAVFTTPQAANDNSTTSSLGAPHSGHNNGRFLGPIEPRTTGKPSNIREPTAVTFRDATAHNR